jgi:hypothetical protein
MYNIRNVIGPLDTDCWPYLPYLFNKKFDICSDSTSDNVSLDLQNSAWPQVFSSGGTCTLLPSFLGVHPNFWGCNVPSNSSFGGTRKLLQKNGGTDTKAMDQTEPHFLSDPMSDRKKVFANSELLCVIFTKNSMVHDLAWGKCS